MEVFEVVALVAFGALVLLWAVLPSQKKVASVSARTEVAAAAAD